MEKRERLSVTVEPRLAEAGRAAVAAGRSESLSAWVNDALARHLAHDARLQALDAFFAEWEAEHGTITEEQMREAERWMDARTVLVDGAAEQAA